LLERLAHLLAELLRLAALAAGWILLFEKVAWISAVIGIGGGAELR
jgi:hypothetical protein